MVSSPFFPSPIAEHAMVHPPNSASGRDSHIPMSVKECEMKVNIKLKYATISLAEVSPKYTN